MSRNLVNNVQHGKRGKPKTGRKSKGNGGSEGGIKMKKGGDLITQRIPLFPLRKKAFLTYFNTIGSVSSSGFSVSSYVFTANGLYDPDITGTGHQPMGFDQLMVFYEHYTVLRAKITVDYLWNTGSGTNWIALSTRADNTVITDPTVLIESGLVDYHMISENLANPMSRHRLVRTVDIKKFGGVDDLMDNENYRGSVAANPTEQTYFHVSAWNPAGVSSTINFTVLIEFEAMFTEPRPPTVSLLTTARPAPSERKN